MKNNGLI